MKNELKIAMERQAYTPKLIAGTCGNCAHFRADMELPAWMRGRDREFGDEHKIEKNMRCGIGGFPVKKLGSCAEWAGSI